MQTGQPAKMRQLKLALRAAFPRTVPVMVGYLFLGAAFGILLESKGYGFGWAALMSIFIYAGSMQFVAVDLLATGAGFLQVILMTLMVNIRHVFYGISMLGKFRNLGAKKPYMIFSLTDETFSLLCTAEPPKNVDRNWFFFFIALFNQLYWIVGSVVGGLLGSSFSFNTQGIDFAMTALFVVILVNQLKKADRYFPFIIGGVSAIFWLIFVEKQYFLVCALATTMIGLIAIFEREKLQMKEEENE